MSFIFVDEDFVVSTKEKIKNRSGLWDDVAFELDRKAKKAMLLGPWSVTFHKSPAASQNPHDYYSEGPYWWPDPKNPQGPYIRRDGEVNPDRFDYHRAGLKDMAETVLYLSLAGFYLDKPQYIQRAVELLYVWFLDDQTKMNPHLEYGQAIRGICEGRGIGIIDTKVLIAVIHACGYILQHDEYHAQIEKLRQWFDSYLEWMNTSKKGLEEKNYFNNHANWWNTQTATYAAFVGRESVLFECFERFKHVILPSQMDTDGSFTDEIKRTRSFSYCLFNLEAGALVCEIAHRRGIDLWNYSTADGKGMRAGIMFMLPYVENPFLWKHQQIEGDLPADDISLQLGGLRLGIAKCLEVNKKRRQGYYLIRNASTIGPLALLPGF